MAKDNEKSKPSRSNRSGKKASSDNQSNGPKLNCILRAKDPKPNDETIKAKFTESDGTEVSEQIRGWKTGDVEANLVALMSRMVSLGEMYDMWDDAPKSKKLCQTMSRALEGQVRDDWMELVNDRADWNDADQKEKFLTMLQKLGQQTFGPKAFKQQCKVLEEGKIKIPEASNRVGTYRLIQINRMLPFLGVRAKSYDVEELNKIIVKSLSPKAMQKYVGDEGDELDDLNDILDMMSTIDAKLALKKEVAALEQQQQKSKGNQQSNNNKGKSNNGGESKGEKKMPCRKHDGEHDWRDCPDNKNRRPQSESKKEKDAAKSQTKKDLHSVQKEDATTKKTPIVRVDESEAEKNRYHDLDYSSDDGSAMMVQASDSNSKLVTGITVVELPDKEGKRHATTILIDTGFTGYALMSHQFAETLGYEFQPKAIQSYRTATGKMETGNAVTVADIRLPAISRHRTFEGTFDVAPPESGDFGYGIIMGIGMMDELGIDQSRTTKMITWGELETPMVPSGYWTDACIQTVCKVTDAKVLDSFSKNKENEEAISKIKGTDKSATISI